MARILHGARHCTGRFVATRASLGGHHGGGMSKSSLTSSLSMDSGIPVAVQSTIPDTPFASNVSSAGPGLDGSPGRGPRLPRLRELEPPALRQLEGAARHRGRDQPDHEARRRERLGDDDAIEAADQLERGIARRRVAAIARLPRRPIDVDDQGPVGSTRLASTCSEGDHGEPLAHTPSLPKGSRTYTAMSIRAGLVRRPDMRKLIVHEFITLDGVMQAPGGKDEDRDGGFAHGGWTCPTGTTTSAHVRRAHAGRRRVPARPPHLRHARRGVRADARRRPVRRHDEHAGEVRRVEDAREADLAQHDDHPRRRRRRRARPQGAARQDHHHRRQQPAPPHAARARSRRRAAPARLSDRARQRQARVSPARGGHRPPFTLVKATPYPTGVVGLHYTRVAALQSRA